MKRIGILFLSLIISASTLASSANNLGGIWSIFLNDTYEEAVAIFEDGVVTQGEIDNMSNELEDVVSDCMDENRDYSSRECLERIANPFKL